MHLKQVVLETAYTSSFFYIIIYMILLHFILCDCHRSNRSITLDIATTIRQYSNSEINYNRNDRDMDTDICNGNKNIGVQNAQEKLTKVTQHDSNITDCPIDDISIL